MKDEVNIENWGIVMRLARSAAKKALELEKDRLREKHDEASGKFKFDNLAYTGIVYTDDPTTAAYFLYSLRDMGDIVGLTAIEKVSIVLGDFPPDATEVERDDPELPRVAILLWKSQDDRCERCWKWTAPKGADICKRCETVINAQE